MAGDWPCEVRGFVARRPQPHQRLERPSARCGCGCGRGTSILPQGNWIVSTMRQRLGRLFRLLRRILRRRGCLCLIWNLSSSCVHACPPHRAETVGFIPPSRHAAGSRPPVSNGGVTHFTPVAPRGVPCTLGIRETRRVHTGAWGSGIRPRR